ncbi:GNAT family N-acetyltransferase [Microbacterium invictum]|uniref:GNAT family N-acetyltransferase n=1 Tax=Microbacterium invictum TaxID=515415 RepID=A0ABZ0VFU2_9MICO|nr:GNAT family N-acetyltransferase [Microbacterium invictum]WQB71702.1 GNAT family N-acetyltransferase [Microbacterium invictum]
MDAAAADAHLARDVDPVSRERLEAQGLEMRMVTDDADRDAFIQVVARGFLDPELTDEQVRETRSRGSYRRLTGVYDPQTPTASAPVATSASWLSELTLPGGGVLPGSAISAVTVAPTHRRRGVARALLEAELRSAVAGGVPLAMLTVSEATLYGRYGFGPAAPAANWVIDTKRAGWRGPGRSGRVDFISRETWREIAPALHEEVRLRSVGELEIPAGHWDSFAGTRPDAKDPGKRRAIQWRDDAGRVRGAALYTVTENSDDWTKSRVDVTSLLAVTPTAYAALWRFLLELDLIGEIHAGELAVDEPLWWMIADQRAATITLRDHQYVRIIDVPRVLEGRTYSGSGEVVLDVEDSLGLSTGRWHLRVVDGIGTVEDIGDSAAAAPVVRLGIEELSAISLGGVSVATLAAAGRLAVDDAETVSLLFLTARAPRLSFWY